MNIQSILLIICFTLFALIGCYLLITRKGRRLVNGLLAGFFLLWALDFLDGFLLISGFYLHHLQWALWTDALILLYGPCIYLFTKNYLKEKPVLKVSDLWHAIPFVSVFCMILFAYHLRPSQEKVEILDRIVNMEQPPEVLFVFLLVYLHFFLYLYRSKKLVLALEQRLLHYFSQMQLQGLLRLLRAIMFLLILSLLNSFLQFYGSRVIFEIGMVFLLLLLGLFMAGLLLKMLDQTSFLLPTRITGRYGGSSLSVEELETLRTKITKTMEKDHLFLNSELTIDDLAIAVGSHPRMVSQAINSGFGKNFFDFINTYRITMAQQLLKENKDPKLTVLEVMYRVGFNSKSSFNTQFRKKTGNTPSEILRRPKES